jgi:hypothetical protein
MMAAVALRPALGTFGAAEPLLPTLVLPTLVLAALVLAALVLTALVLAAVALAALLLAAVMMAARLLPTLMLAARLLPTLLLAARLLPTLIAAVGAQDAVVMLRVLEIIFRRDIVSGRGSIARQREVFFQDLIDGSANANLGTVAVEHLGTGCVVVVRSSGITPAARTL